MAYKVYKISELFTHMRLDCPKRKKTCPHCMLEFQNTEECFTHLKENCEHVQVQCDTCNKLYSRARFRQHVCYLKTGNFREVINRKQEVIEKIQKENRQLMKGIEEADRKMEEDVIDYEATLRDLKSRVVRHEEQRRTDTNILDEITQKCIEEKQKYAKS